jgi:ABC-type nitrate/sulfonate/bicarbonate transport system substrate-binding protein
MLPEYRITAGFMPLTDSLLLVVAKERGFAGAEGVDLTLVRESSWANIRDRVAVGHFDVAHMLAPMPIAATLGLTPIAVPMIAPMVLGLGGNAVTVSRSLWDRMAATGAPPDLDPLLVGQALARVVEGTETRLRFGVVHPHSGHNYELRYWLAASGIDPDRNVEIVVLPPPLMPDAIRTGGIDGYCVGEPWNSVAVSAGAGRIATVKAAIWPRSPEKVLGVTESWAVYNPEALSALLRALYQAAQWCGNPSNHAEAAALLSRSDYLGLSTEIVGRALSGELTTGDGSFVTVPHFFEPHAGHATLPRVAHGLWFYAQMVRWSDVQHTDENARLAQGCFRPDLYRKALGSLVPDLPKADGRPLGRSDFFDGRGFDPADLKGYIASQRPYA